MRFSSIFHMSMQPRDAARADVPARVEWLAAPAAQTVRPPAPEMPDDLDQRVRLLGEWQVGEA